MKKAFSIAVALLTTGCIGVKDYTLSDKKIIAGSEICLQLNKQSDSDRLLAEIKDSITRNGYQLTVNELPKPCQYTVTYTGEEKWDVYWFGGWYLNDATITLREGDETLAHIDYLAGSGMDKFHFPETTVGPLLDIALNNT